MTPWYNANRDLKADQQPAISTSIRTPSTDLYFDVKHDQEMSIIKDSNHIITIIIAIIIIVVESIIRHICCSIGCDKLFLRADG